MPTRPVTWDLDVPPKTLLEPAKQPPIGDVPSLKKLRNSLMGTRFELLKISAFAAFLLGFVGVSIHGSHLTNPDNPFVANTSAAFRGITSAISSRAIALRDKTETVALAMVETVKGHAANSSLMVANAGLHPHGAHTHRNSAEAVQVASLEPQHHAHRARRHHETADLASADMSSSVQWSGNLVDLPNFVTAKSSEAGHRLVNAVEGNIDLNAVPKLRNRGQRVAESFGSHFDVTNAQSLTMRDPSSMVAGLLTPDSIVAGMAALLLYMIFVVVLVQIKGGLRALGGNQAAA